MLRDGWEAWHLHEHQWLQLTECFFIPFLLGWGYQLPFCHWWLPAGSKQVGRNQSVQEWFQAFRKLGCLASSWSSRVTALTYSLYSGDQHRAGYPLSCHSPNFSIQPKAITNLLSVSTDFSVLNISYEWSDVILWSCGTGLLHLV